MKIHIKNYVISIFSLLSLLQSWFFSPYYPYRSFKHSNWWRPKLFHT